MGGPKWDCLLPFDTDDPMFTRGFEMGRLWGLLREFPDDAAEGVLVHATNAEMVIRIGEALDRTVEGDPNDDETWLLVTFGPEGS